MDVPEIDVPEIDVPEIDVLEIDVLEIDVPERDVPEIENPEKKTEKLFRVAHPICVSELFCIGSGNSERGENDRKQEHHGV